MLDNCWDWFNKEFLSAQWLQTWVDFYRSDSREGFFNTNDFSEALLISLLVETVFPWYESKVQSDESATVCQ